MKRMNRNHLRLLSLVLALQWCGVASSPARAGWVDVLLFKKAPSFRADLPWLNTPAPLSLEQLQGKFVLLAFWSYSSTPSLQTIGQLKQLQARYPRDLVVIGVHSAKFTAERDLDNLRHAVIREGLTFPVIHDPQRAMWRDYGVQAWPTMVLIDPRGEIIYKEPGEQVLEPVESVLKKWQPFFRQLMRPDPLPQAREADQEPLEVLSYPTHVLADPMGQRLFISDTGHQRVLVTDLDGRIQTVIGGGSQNATAGTLAEAPLRDPRGLALDGQTLYIADRTGNRVWAADLQNGTVRTVAGTGEPGPARHTANGPALETPVTFPEDLLLKDQRLYIAADGMHQILTLDLTTGRFTESTGSGVLNMIDGPARRSALASPTGMVEMGGILYFCDSAASAVRQFPLAGKNGRVETLIGKGLFDFGDQDGTAKQARLQHSQGLALLPDGNLLISDTFNNKIKVLNPADGTVRTLCGRIRAGDQDGAFTQAGFNHPTGISAAAGRVYLADTNNHRIRVLDLANQQVRTLMIRPADETAVRPVRPGRVFRT